MVGRVQGCVLTLLNVLHFELLLLGAQSVAKGFTQDSNRNDGEFNSKIVCDSVLAYKAAGDRARLVR